MVKTSLALLVVALATSGCFGTTCEQVPSGWSYPEIGDDGTPNMIRYQATTFTVCRPRLTFRWK